MSPRCNSCSGRSWRLDGDPGISVMEKLAMVGEMFAAPDDKEDGW